MDVDAVVIGAGPNGLVAANQLVDQGWDVLVLEAQPEPGGAVRSAELLEPGVITDRFSAFYPLGVVSPHIRRLGLEHYGLQWCHAPAALAHPTIDGPAAVIHDDAEQTAASLDRFAPGDGDAWREHYDDWQRYGDALVDAALAPFPPVRAGVRLFRRNGVRGTAELARTAVLSSRRMSEEWFDGAGGRLLITGCALHADLTPDTALGGLYGWLLAAIGQQHGWPVPRGGSGALTQALVRRFNAAGGQLHCGREVVTIDCVDGRAVAVRTIDGHRIGVRRGVLADVSAPNLYGHLLAPAAVPDRTRREMRRYQHGLATFKVNWSVDGGIPWTDPAVADAGTVHVAQSMDELTVSAAQITMGQLPRDPFVLLGQMTTADASRSPDGVESVWAYTSIPQEIRGDAGGDLTGVDAPDDAERFADRLQQRIEAFAPGFTSRIRHRCVQTPAGIERDDANLRRGDKSLGTAQIHQQLVFRPTIGLGRPETSVDGLFLASASAHPGGGVHGACGAHAARAAVLADRRRRLAGLLPGVSSR
jgi:phytoene dehydrogenase-like protein